MALCHEYGIGHSQYMQWDPADRDLALAFMEYKATLCNKCGTDPKDWLDAKGRLLEPLPYQASTVMCHGCATLEEAKAMVDDKAKVGIMNFSLRKLPKKLAEEVHKKWQMSKST